MANKEILKKQIIYRSMHRGTKEMDLLLGNFVKKYIDKFNNSELKDLEKTIAFHREIIDTAEVYKRMRVTGDEVFRLHTAIPLVWKPEELVYNPNVVASYKWSGVPLGTISHFERFLAVKK